MQWMTLYLIVLIHCIQCVLGAAAHNVFSAQAKQQFGSEPYQWKDIKGRPDAHLWEEAAMQEFVSLIENGTFEPVRLPPSRKSIGCR